MTAIAPAPYQPDRAIPPGETIREMLEAKGMPQAELAHRMGRPANKLNEIIQGKRQITADTALELELALSLPGSFWMNLEKNYQLTKARLAQERSLQVESQHLPRFPTKEMAKLRWIQKCDDAIAQTREMLSFFGINSFEQLKQVKSLAPAWLKSGTKRACEYALAAWLQQGIRQAQRIKTGKFSPSGLRAQLAELRPFTREDPNDFEPAVVELCATHGVAVTFVPHLPKSYVNGAAYWFNEQVIIQLSLRFKWADIFWFTFFHELGHVLLHLRAKKRAFLDEKGFGRSPDIAEMEANRFAATTLISEKDYQALLQRPYARAEVVRQFAQQIGVAPGIVVGRLQFDEHLQYCQLNELRSQYEWRDEDRDEASDDAS